MCLPFGHSVAPCVFTKLHEASGKCTAPNQTQTDHLPGRYTYSPSVQASAGDPGGTDMPITWSFGHYDKQEEVPPVTSSTFGVFGLPSVLNQSEVCDSPIEKLWKTRQDAHHLLQQTTVSVRELARL